MDEERRVYVETEGKLIITNRELQEFRFAMEYEAQFAHGTTGHNQLMLLAKTARFLGFRRDTSDIPPTVIVNDMLSNVAASRR